MTAYLSPVFDTQFFDGSTVAAGYKLYTYDSGTTTPKTTYTDQAGGTPNTNPIILDSAGRCNLWLGTGEYTFVLKTATDATVWTKNNVAGASTTVNDALIRSDLASSSDASKGAALIGFSGRTLRAKLLDERVSLADIGCLFDGSDEAAKVNAALSGGGQFFVPAGKTLTFTRLYITASNTTIETDAGATLKQTLTGITNNNTAGQDPAYAAIHIHPVGYKAGGGVAVTKISNVRVSVRLRGPYTSGAYNEFSMGIVSNDCDDCHVDDGDIYGFRGENVLHAPASYNVVNNVTINRNKIVGGGEVGANKADGFEIAQNYVASSWSMNGIGASGTNGNVLDNLVRDMVAGGLTIGGSGTGSGKVKIRVAGNRLRNTGTGGGAVYAAYLSDDGATTVVKDIEFSGNHIDGHSGSVGIAADYASASSIVRMDGNDVQGINYAGGGVGFAPIAGSATYITRNNTVTPCGANQDRGFDVLGGSPVVLMRGGDYIYGHSLNDVQGPSDFIIGEYMGTAKQVVHVRPLSVQSGIEFKAISLVYGATVTPQSDGGLIQRVNVTNTTAFTVAKPTGSFVGPIFMQVINTSGAAHGTINWTAAGSGGYLLASTVTVPNGQRVTIGFAYNGTYWEEISRSGAV